MGVILHFHCMHQFPACDGDANGISKIKLRGFTVRSFYAACAGNHTSNKTPTFSLNCLPSAQRQLLSGVRKVTIRGILTFAWEHK
jgi:hypothetical protein